MRYIPFFFLLCSCNLFFGSSGSDKPDPDESDMGMNQKTDVTNDVEDCECDSDAMTQTCESLKLGGGELRCDDDCGFDTSKCEKAPGCGDGKLDVNEECEEEELRGKTCQSFTFDSGLLYCDRNRCRYDLLECYTCGDTIVDDVEDCDGTNFRDDADCRTYGYDGGTLLCAEGCLDVDFSQCFKCNDGVRHVEEQCDGDDLNDITCQTLDFSAGDVSCSTECKIITTACVP